MEKFLPYEKLSKKEKRKIDQTRRQTNLYDPTLADAICDRIVYDSYIIRIKGNATRKAQGHYGVNKTAWDRHNAGPHANFSNCRIGGRSVCFKRSACQTSAVRLSFRDGVRRDIISHGCGKC